MKGMEMMLANMLGMKPDEMQAIFVGVHELATTAAEKLTTIADNQAVIMAQQSDIIARFERFENGDGNDNG